MGNIDLRKQNKRNLILDLIRTGPRASRSSLRNDSGLAMKTVLQCVEDLLTEGLILETGKGGASVGRRATYLAINPDGCYWLGLKFTAQTLTCAAIDFSGAIWSMRQEHLKPEANAEAVLTQLCRCVQEEAQRLRNAGKRLAGLGVGVPGMVDAERGLGVRFVQIPDWENIPIRQRLEDAARCPVYLEQSVRTTALANLMEPENLAVENLLYVLVRSGVGMAVLLGREPLSGHTGIAGEIGHVRAAEHGAPCSCGRQGCLESEISHKALARRMREGMLQGKFPGVSPEEAGITALMDGVFREDTDCLSLWNQASDQLFAVLSPIIAALNPQKIIFSGELTTAPGFSEKARRYFQDCCSLNACDSLELAVAPFDEQYDAIGAACLSLYHAYGVWGAGKVSSLREEMSL